MQYISIYVSYFIMKYHHDMGKTSGNFPPTQLMTVATDGLFGRA